MAEVPVQESDSPEARLARYRVYDEVNAPYLRWQLEQFESFLGKRVLEVGCGIGGVIAQLGQRELVMGIDIEELLVDFARKRFAKNPGHEFACADISLMSDEMIGSMKRKRFDTVVCINVLEHVEDHDRATRAMADVLLPGGELCLLVPAHPSLFGPYDVTDGHFRRYTKDSLRKVLEGTGFEVTRLYYFNAVGAAGWWLQYKVLHRNNQTTGDYKMMLRVLPLVRAIESRLKPPVGMSLIAVGKKKPDAMP
jgi:SAM-dependent methyltransferase